MDFKGDAAFKNIQVNNTNNQHMFKIKIKNLPEDSDGQWIPNTVYDLNPGTYGNYREENLFVYNGLRDIFEINPYFMIETSSSSGISSVQSTGPYTINGIYPLYTTEEAANAVSDINTSTLNTINGVNYWMPNMMSNLYPNTPTPTGTLQGTPTQTSTGTFQGTPTQTGTETSTGTFQGTPTQSGTPTITGSQTPTGTFQGTPTMSGTQTSTGTIQGTPTPTETITPTMTSTTTLTSTPSMTATLTIMNTSTPTMTQTIMNTSTPTMTQTIAPEEVFSINKVGNVLSAPYFKVSDTSLIISKDGNDETFELEIDNSLNITNGELLIPGLFFEYDTNEECFKVHNDVGNITLTSDYQDSVGNNLPVEIVEKSYPIIFHTEDDTSLILRNKWAMINEFIRYDNRPSSTRINDPTNTNMVVDPSSSVMLYNDNDKWYPIRMKINPSVVSNTNYTFNGSNVAVPTSGFANYAFEVEGNKIAIGFNLTTIQNIQQYNDSENIVNFPPKFNLVYPSLQGDLFDFVSFTDNFTTSNFEDTNAALIPSLLGNFSQLQANDVIYVVYKGTINGVSPSFTNEGIDYTIVAKDQVSIQNNVNYVLTQMRGINSITTNGYVSLDDLMFLLHRNNVTYDLSLLQDVGGLTQQIIERNSISSVTEENWYNNTIDLTSEDYFLRFSPSYSTSTFQLSTVVNKMSMSNIKPAKKKHLQNYNENIVDTWTEFDEQTFIQEPKRVFFLIKSQNINIVEEGDLLLAYVFKNNVETIVGITNADFMDDSVTGVVEYEFTAGVKTKLIEIKIYDENLDSNDEIYFRLYKKNTTNNTAGNMIYDLHTIINYNDVQSYETPNDNNILYLGTFNISLEGPYADFSYNVNVLNAVKENIFRNNNDGTIINKVKSYRDQYYTALQVSDNVWISSTLPNGALFSDEPLSYETFYTIQIDEPVTFNIEGTPIMEPTLLTLSKGYNWIGYTPTRKALANDVLEHAFPQKYTYNGSEYDMISSIVTRNDGSLFNNNGTYFGSLNEMKPGGGYIIYVGKKDYVPSTLETTMTYYNTSSYNIYNTPSGYYKINLENNPFPDVLKDVYIYIEEYSINISFIYEEQPYTINSPIIYAGFGVYDTDYVSLPSIIELNLNNALIELTHIKMRVGFTTTDGVNYSVNGILDFEITDKILNQTFYLSQHALAILDILPPYKMSGTSSVDVPEKIINDVGRSAVQQLIPNINDIYKLLYYNNSTKMLTFEINLINMTTAKPLNFEVMTLIFNPEVKVKFESVYNVAPPQALITAGYTNDNEIRISSSLGTILQKLTITVKIEKLEIPVDLIYPGIESKLYLGQEVYPIFEFTTQSPFPSSTPTPTTTLTTARVLSKSIINIISHDVSLKTIILNVKFLSMIDASKVHTVEIILNDDILLDGIQNIVSLNEQFDLKFAQGNKIQLLSLNGVQIVDDMRITITYTNTISDSIEISTDSKITNENDAICNIF